MHRCGRRGRGRDDGEAAVLDVGGRGVEEAGRCGRMARPRTDCYGGEVEELEAELVAASSCSGAAAVAGDWRGKAAVAAGARAD